MTAEIICFSKTGQSLRLGEQIASALNGNLQAVTTPRYHMPVLGWLAAGRDGFRGASPPLNEALHLPDGDELVVVVGPVWAGKPSAPLNTVVDQLGNSNLRVAAAMTCADPKESTAPLEILQNRLGRALVAQMIISNRHRAEADIVARVKAFAVQCNVGVEWQG